MAGNTQTKDIQSRVATTALAGYIERCYSTSKSAMQHITERLLKCERQRRGEYDPDVLAKIRQSGGSELFLMLTDIKCRAAESWIKDVMVSAGEMPWACEHTKIPELHAGIQQGVMQQVMRDAQEMMQQGFDITQEDIIARTQMEYDQIQRRMQDAADYAAEKMGMKIEDILQEAQWTNTFMDIIYDFVTFPFCVFKGPVLKKRKTMKWGQGWVPEVTDEMAWDFERVSPYDCFPSSAATGVHDGVFIRRHRMMIPDIEALVGLPGYRDDAIFDAINQYKSAGLRDITYGETEREWLSGRRQSLLSNEIIEALEFWGDAHGSMLREWGLKVDENKVYPITAWKIGNHVIYAQLNPDPMGDRPYSHACFERIPGSFVGKALPEMMRDVQEMCNSSGRALQNNMGVASGPQVEVSVDRLPPGEEVTQVYPWRIWQTTSDRTGGGQPAVRFFQPDMNAETLLNVLQYFTKIADEVTGIPNYIYGSGTTGGAGRTASGLSMLMDNASKGIKQSIITLDRAVIEMINRLFVKIMMYDSDNSIKGDIKIIPSGIVGALIKDHIQEKRQLFLQTVTNPIDQQILGMKGRANLLRQMSKGLHLDMDNVIPDDQELQGMNGPSPEVQQQMQQMQQLIQQLQQQVSDKSAELDVKREEIEARKEIARINASTDVEARMHDSEVRSINDAEARIQAANIDRETKLDVAQMAAEAKVQAAQMAEETKRITAEQQHSLARDTQAGTAEQDVSQLLQSAIEPLMKRIDEMATRPDEPREQSQPVVVNLQVDAKSGEVKKSIKINKDANGKITGAEVTES